MAPKRGRRDTAPRRSSSRRRVRKPATSVTPAKPMRDIHALRILVILLSLLEMFVVGWMIYRGWTVFFALSDTMLKPTDRFTRPVPTIADSIFPCVTRPFEVDAGTTDCGNYSCGDFYLCGTQASSGFNYCYLVNTTCGDREWCINAENLSLADQVSVDDALIVVVTLFAIATILLLLALFHCICVADQHCDRKKLCSVIMGVITVLLFAAPALIEFTQPSVFGDLRDYAERKCYDPAGNEAFEDAVGYLDAHRFWGVAGAFIVFMTVIVEIAIRARYVRSDQTRHRKRTKIAADQQAYVDAYYGYDDYYYDDDEYYSLDADDRGARSPRRRPRGGDSMRRTPRQETTPRGRRGAERGASGGTIRPRKKRRRRKRDTAYDQLTDQSGTGAEYDIYGFYYGSDISTLKSAYSASAAGSADASLTMSASASGSASASASASSTGSA